jgi:hypothetical protein
VTEEVDGIWLRTDEIDEFIDALQHCAELISTVGIDVRRWKWVILAMHSAVQGVCTCALRGADTAGISVLTKDSGKAVWNWLDVESRMETPGPMPNERLASMVDLYRRIRKAKFLSEPHRLKATEQMTRDILRLNHLRNDFIHFVPKGLSLEVSGMPRIITNCCDVIEHLAVTHPTFWHHLDESQTRNIEDALLKLRMAMKACSLN